MAKEDKRQYLVTATFTDKETGDTILPGSYFPATEQRARRLQASGVIADDDTGMTPDAADTDKKPVKTKTTKDDTPDVPDTPSTPDVPDAGGDDNGDADKPQEG